MAANKPKIFALFIALLFFAALSSAQPGAENVSCAVYITGIGCPYCAKADPFLLKTKLEENPALIIIEYEIYQQPENAVMVYAYNDKYGSGTRIPQITFGEGNVARGATEIVEKVQKVVDLGDNPCPMPQGPINFSQLNLSKISGNPKIWSNGRVLIPNGKGNDDALLRELLLSENIAQTLSKTTCTEISPHPVPYSGGQIEFERAVDIGGWIFQWNGTEELPENCGKKIAPINGSGTTSQDEDIKSQLTLPKLISLAAVDAVNPCALAVLTLILVAILTYNPKRKSKVLLAGLAFSLAVFIMYLFYGLVIIKFFQLIQVLTSIRLMLYTVLGIAAILLGIINIKDYIRYKPGGLGTEMPMYLRPLVKKIVSGVTSTKGAFVVGLLVTVFLLPCTIGPYVIAGGILSALEILKTIPLLLLYNFIFILPMLAITVVIYIGMARVEDVSEWKERNIRYLHLVAGIIILLLGIAMVFGLV